MKFWRKVKEELYYSEFYFTYLRVKAKELLFKRKATPINKLTWFGAYGNTNIGDDLIFFSLKQYVPANVEISLSCRQKVPTTDYGVKTFDRWDKEQIAQEIKSSDFVFLGGGGLFEYYQKLHKKEVTRNVPSYLYTLLNARLQGKRYAIVGIGCNEGPFPNRILRTVFGDIARNAAFIITRDQKSYRGFLNNGGRKENLFSNYDPVFSLPASIDKAGATVKQGPPVVGFLIWPFHLHPYFHHVEGVKEISKQIAPEKLQKFRSFCNEMKNTFKLLKESNITTIFPLFHFSDKVLLDELDCEYNNEISFSSYFSQLKQCDVVVSMRYHGQITTILNNIPLVSIPVQEKMSALVENFKIENQSIDIEAFNADQCISIIKNVLKNKEAIKIEQNETFNRISQEVKDVYGKIISTFLA